jgi:hypothetical protein
MEDNIELDNLNRPEGAEGGEDETVIDNTPIDEDDFLSGLDGLDDAKTSSFREENRDDGFPKRKIQLNELSTYGKFDDIKVEYVKRLQGSDYRINANDGPISRDLLSSLDITKNKLTYKGTEVAYIDTNGIYRHSTNKRYKRLVSEFNVKFSEAVGEHRERAKSVVEEETGGEASGVNAEEIFEDAEEEFRQEVINAGDNLAEHARELEERGKITTQDRREFAGVTAPKGPPEERRKYLNIQMKELDEKIEGETDNDRRQIVQGARDVTERAIDSAELEMGQIPRSEDGKHRFREIVRENIRTKFERFRKWAKENLGAIAAIAISIAGIITTVVVAGKKTIVGASKGLGAVGKALARLAKSALPILVPILNLLSTILSWGAKGLAFLAQNLWIVAVLIAGAIYKYLQMKRKK